MAGVGLLLGFALAGCKPKAAPGVSDANPAAEHSADGQPTTEDVAGFLRAAAPPFARVGNVKMDVPSVMPNTSPAQHLWLCSVRFAFTPTEDLLGPASDQDARAFQAVAEELAGWTRWQEAYARSPYARLSPAPAWHAPALPAPAGQPVLTRLHAATEPLPPIYARLAADWQVDHWRFRAVELDTPDYGEPRASFAAPNVVLGSPVALAFGQAARAACAQAGQDKAALDARYQTDLAQATRPGTLFRGQLTHRGQTVPAEVRLLPPAEGSGVDPARDVDLEVRLPATPGESFTYQAQRSSQVPLGSPATATVTDTSTPEPLAASPRGDLRLRLRQANGKDGPYSEAIAVKLLYLSRHEPPQGEIWLHLHDGHLEGRLSGYSTDAVGIVLGAQAQAPASTAAP